MLVRVRLWLWWMLPINGVWWMLVLGSLTLMNACYDCVVDNKFVRYMSNHLYSTRMKALKSSSLSFHLETYFFCFLSSFPVFKPLLSLFLFILKLISSASSLLSHTRIWILEINLVRHPILLICWTVNKILTFLKTSPYRTKSWRRRCTFMEWLFQWNSDIYRNSLPTTI